VGNPPLEDGRAHGGDQRAAARAPIAGTAIVLARRKYVGTYLVENLSASGSLLVGDTRLAVGDRVRVLLCAGERMFSLSAVVVRHDSRDPQGVFAVRFVEPSPAAQDAIQNLVLHRLRAAAAGHALIVVVDGKEGGLEPMVSDLQSLGRRALRVETALAAIACLQARGDPVAAVIVDERWVDGLRGLALLEFVSMDYPSIRRIVACEHADPDCEAALEQGQVDAVLEKPWSRDSLLGALDEKT
jgi:hypothetical protein